MIEGAFRVLDDFEAVDASHRGDEGAAARAATRRCAFATAALALRFGERSVEETEASGRRRSRPSS